MKPALELSSQFQKYFDEPIKGIEDLEHAGNNRIYRVSLDSGERILKVYSKEQHDGWNRGRTEFSTLTKLTNLGFNDVPRPYSFDEGVQIGVYSFERGSPLQSSELNETHIIEMSNFLARMHKIPPKIVETFPLERTRCLSGDEYFDLLFRRWSVIEKDFTDKFIGNEAREFFYNTLHQSMIRLEDGFELGEKNWGGKLDIEEQKVNPGDFGPHNILFDSEKNKYTFHDFEFAGRDDPAKQLLDFLHHARTSELSRDLKYKFIYNYFRKNPENAESVMERMKTFDKVIGMNWVLIYLNVLSETYQNHLTFGTGNKLEDIVKLRFGKAIEKSKHLSYFND